MAKPNYGIDAPGVVRNMALISAAGFLGGTLWRTLHVHPPAPAAAFFSVGVWFGITALAMLASSLWGKFRVRDKLLETIPWRGDERVLDVGCGHGLMLIGAAKRLTTGRAIGIDIWQHEDQANNNPDDTRANAELEGVTDRVEVRDGDARNIPFEDASFDVILSSLVIHNIYDRAERQKALSEILRVTKPGGHIGIIDIRHGSQYVKYFVSQGLTVVRNRPTFLFFMLTDVMVLRKPA